MVLLGIAFALELTIRAVLFVQHRWQAPAQPVFNLVGVGESTMRGWPFEPHIEIPIVVARMLGGEVNGRHIAIENLAANGQPAYAQYVALLLYVAYRDRTVPGAVLIYVGHNEGDLRQGAAWRPGVLERVADYSFVARAIHLLLVYKHVIPLPHGLPLYRYYLRKMIETATGAGLVPIVSTVAGNISGVEPNLEARDTAEVELRMQTIAEQEHRGDCTAVESACRAEAAAAHPIAPLVCYRAGKCWQRAGEVARAVDRYYDAIELDPRTNFGRATRAQNAVVRELAREYAIPLVDTTRLLEDASPQGILGDELFIDGQHPNLIGVLLIARAYADAIAAAFGTPLPRRDLQLEEMKTEFGFTPRFDARSKVHAASWLIATAALHPWPYDRLALAEQHLHSALATDPDNFTAWFDLALVEAGRRGLLRDDALLKQLGEWSVFFCPLACVPQDEVDPMIDRFRTMGVSADVIAGVLRNRSRACAGEDKF